MIDFLSEQKASFRKSSPSTQIMHYVYLIRNIKTHETYVGYTEDLRRRLKEHHGKNPELIYYEAYKNKKDAQERERKLKQRGQSIRWLRNRLKNSLI